MKAKLRLSFYEGQNHRVVAILALDCAAAKMLRTYVGESYHEIMNQLPDLGVDWTASVKAHDPDAVRIMVASNVELSSHPDLLVGWEALRDLAANMPVSSRIASAAGGPALVVRGLSIPLDLVEKFYYLGAKLAGRSSKEVDHE
jgi:hypothetical protein